MVRSSDNTRTMFSMEMVVERGLARCPRCVAVADYFFVELSPNLLRYEVDCGSCGEVYREEHGPVPPQFGGLAATDAWLPEAPVVPMRERVQVWVDATRSRARALPAALVSVKLTQSALLLLPRRGRYQ